MNKIADIICRKDEKQRHIASWLILFVIWLCSTSVEAKNYYISDISGNDNRTSIQAQDPTSPWKTISKLNSSMPPLNPGDSILFKRGETFSGNIIISKSGTALQPITIGSYGNGPKPVINSFLTLTSWKSLGKGIYESSCKDCSFENNILMINGVLQALGRFPDRNYLSYETHIDNASIIDNQLQNTPNWTGAEVVIRKNRWIIDKSEILSHLSSKINYPSGSKDQPIANFGYFIQKDFKTLDQLGEWYFDISKKKMQIFFGNNKPTSYTIKTSTLNSLISLIGANHIIIDNISLQGANSSAFEIKNSQHITIKNCSIDNSGADAITASWSTYLTIENSNINHSLNNGINLDQGCNNAIVKNNMIKNTGLIPGMGKSGSGSYQGIMSFGANAIIEFNTIDSTGYNGIYFGGNSSEVRNNFINNFCLIKDDGGGIYVGDWFPNSEKKIIGNIILNGKGLGEGTNNPDYKAAQGIYIDEPSTSVEISNNSVAHCEDTGIFIHNASKIDIRNNTFFNNGVQLSMSEDNISLSHLIRKTHIENNIFFAKKEPQLTAIISSVSNDINSFGYSDNNYFIRPLDDRLSLLTSFRDSGKTFWNAYDLKGWQSASNKDQQSHTSPIVISNYTLTNVRGSNKVPGGTFSTNAWNAFAWSDDSSPVTSWDNTGKIDGGALKVSYTALSKTNAMVTVGITDAGTVDSSKNYLLRFTTIGGSTKRNIGVYLQQPTSPFHKLTPVKYIDVPASRSDNEVLFSFPKTASNANIVFQLSDSDGSIWLDNIELYEADVTVTNPDDHFRFEFNATNSPLTISLDKSYMDVKGTIYESSLTLKPFTSVVLIALSSEDKSSQTITFPKVSDKMYGDTVLQLKAVSSSGLPVEYEIVEGEISLNGDLLALKGTGRITIKASQKGDEKYNSAPEVTQTFNVNKAEQSTSFDLILSKTFGDSPFTVNCTSISGLPFSYKIVSGPASIFNSEVTLKGSGTVVIEAFQSGNTNYEAASVTRSFTVNKSNQSITFPVIQTKTFTDTPFELSASAGSNLAIKYKIISGSATISGNKVTLLGSGTVVIEASQIGSVNYNEAPTVTQSFTVNKANQNIYFSAISVKTLGDAPFLLAASVGSGLPISYVVKSGPAIISENTVTLVGSGNVTIEAFQKGNANYNAASVLRSFLVTPVINKRVNQTITFPKIPSQTLANTPFSLKASSSSGLQVNYRVIDGLATIADNVITFTGSGNIAIEASQPGNEEYNPAPAVTQNFMVIKANQNIAFTKILTKNIDDAPFTIQATSTSGLPVSFQIISGPAIVSGDILRLTAAGKIVIKASQSGNGNYNPASEVTQTFSVNKADQRINFAPIPDKGTDDAPFNLIATSNNKQIPILFTSSNPSVVSVSNETGLWLATINNSGSATITASQIEDTRYQYAKISQLINVNEQLGFTPDEIHLSAFPNPFTKQLNIKFVSSETGRVILKVYNLQGKLVKLLHDGVLYKGEPKQTVFNAEELAMGVYIVHLSTASKTIFKKVIFAGM